MERSHFKFNKQEQSGIFFLLLLLVFVVGLYGYIKYIGPNDWQNTLFVDEPTQMQVDSLRSSAFKELANDSLYPFNPNFITDYKGYVLGMSTEQIDKLHQFRSQNKYVNSAQEFQQVTQVSDSLLLRLAPFFRFPEWKLSTTKTAVYSYSPVIAQPKKDLNTVNAEELKKIYGIGDKLSARIIKFRTRLGGFLVNEQLYDVYGLEVEVAAKVLDQYQVLSLPSIQKINVNTATSSELASLVYIPYNLAERIVEKRSREGTFNDMSDLFTIDGFPLNKKDRIALYLSF